MQLTRDGTTRRRSPSSRTRPRRIRLRDGLLQAGAGLRRQGFDDKAEQASRRAMELSENLPTQDKYLIEASHASIVHDNAKAIAAYENLVKVNPDDTDAQFALATLYEASGDYAQARKYLAKVLASDPKNVAALLASGRVEIRDGNSQAALDPLNRPTAWPSSSATKRKRVRRCRRSESPISVSTSPKMRCAITSRRSTSAASWAIRRAWPPAWDRWRSCRTRPNFNAALKTIRKPSKSSEDRRQERPGENLMSLGVLPGLRASSMKPKTTNEALPLARDMATRSFRRRAQNIGNGHFNKGEYQDALTYLPAAYTSGRLKLRTKWTALHDLGETNSKLGHTRR